jgi:lipoate-protein ligase A
MHGEYKVPGGKLVVVDLEIVNGRLCDVEISGDFFLEPETTLDRITAAIEGMASTATEHELAQQVAAASRGAELLGITPTGVAIAVRRATGETT